MPESRSHPSPARHGAEPDTPEDPARLGDAPFEESAADPDAARPSDPSDFEGADRPALWIGRRTVRAGAMLAVVLVVALVWWRSPIREATDLGTALDWARSLAEHPFASGYMIAAYVLGGFLVFPVTVLTAVTGILFGFVPGVLIALAGMMTSALVLYGVGAGLGGPMLRVAGPRIQGVSRRLADRGVITIALIRQVPIAPFSLISLAAGASHIRLRDYLLGTFFGMGPGVVVITLFGDAIESALTSPTPGRVGLLFATGSAIVLTGWAVHVVFARLRRRRA
ncbi:MAG: VTT domain-containing protein [Azospirillaceae bacterium]